MKKLFTAMSVFGMMFMPFYGSKGNSYNRNSNYSQKHYTSSNSNNRHEDKNQSDKFNYRNNRYQKNNHDFDNYYDSSHSQNYTFKRESNFYSQLNSFVSRYVKIGNNNYSSWNG